MIKSRINNKLQSKNTKQDPHQVAYKREPQNAQEQRETVKHAPKPKAVCTEKKPVQSWSKKPHIRPSQDAEVRPARIHFRNDLLRDELSYIDEALSFSYKHQSCTLFKAIKSLEVAQENEPNLRHTIN